MKNLQRKNERHDIEERQTEYSDNYYFLFFYLLIYLFIFFNHDILDYAYPNDNEIYNNDG